MVNRCSAGRYLWAPVLLYGSAVLLARFLFQLTVNVRAANDVTQVQRASSPNQRSPYPPLARCAQPAPLPPPPPPALGSGWG